MKIRLLTEDALVIWNCYLYGAVSDGEWENSWYSGLCWDAEVSLAEAPEDFGIENGFGLSTKDKMRLLAFRPSDVLSFRLNPKKKDNDFGYMTRDDLLAILVMKSLGMADDEIEDKMYRTRGWERPDGRENREPELSKRILETYSKDPAKWLLRLWNAMTELDLAFRTTYWPQIGDEDPKYVCWFAALLDGFAPDSETEEYGKLKPEWRSGGNQIEYDSWADAFPDKLEKAKRQLAADEKKSLREDEDPV